MIQDHSPDQPELHPCCFHQMKAHPVFQQLRLLMSHQKLPLTVRLRSLLNTHQKLLLTARLKSLLKPLRKTPLIPLRKSLLRSLLKFPLIPLQKFLLKAHGKAVHQRTHRILLRIPLLKAPPLFQGDQATLCRHKASYLYKPLSDLPASDQGSGHLSRY